ncbi:MAG: hypothetical protein Q4A67_07225 [Aerococcus sp.]|nr:hypothetical protein [Aerococcus sp.]
MNKETKTALVALGGLAAIAAVAALIYHEEDQNQSFSRAIDDLNKKFEDGNYQEKLTSAGEEVAKQAEEIPQAVRDWFKSLAE